MDVEMRVHRSSAQFFLMCVGVIVIIIITRKMIQPTPPPLVRESPVPTPSLYLPEDPWQTEPEVLFGQNFNGYNTSRIPALIFHKGHFIAICEGRKDTSADIGRIDLVARRGMLVERSVLWGDMQVVASLYDYRLMNPTPIIEREMDVIILVFIGIPAWVDQFEMVSSGENEQRVFMVKSYDNGESWTGVRDITDSTMGRLVPPPSIFAPGPGHGIQLKSGRLMFAANYFVRDEAGLNNKEEVNFLNSSNYAVTFWSDDNGRTWEVGGGITDPTSKETFAPIYANEVMLVELENSRICMNCRTLRYDMPRVQAFSNDQGLTFSKATLAMDLVEPGFRQEENETLPAYAGGCQASLIGFPAPPNHPSRTSHWVLFSNPASSIFREHMSVRLSRDGCKTWSVPWAIHANSSGYSDLAYFETGGHSGRTQNFGMLFEGGYETSFENIYFKMFNLEALLSGIQNGTNSFTHKLSAGGERDFDKLRYRPPK